MQVDDIEDWSALRSVCPRGVFGSAVGSVDSELCTYCGECTRRDVHAAARVRVSPQKGEFEFTVEGTGVLPPQAALRAALRALRGKVRGLREAVGHLESDEQRATTDETYD